MQFQAEEVSASAAGDYYQLYLGPKETEEDAADPFNVRGPYLLIQRQFEMFDGGKCYVESDNEEYLGHFHLNVAEFSPTQLSFEIQRKNNKHVNVSFSLTASEFEQVRAIAEVVLGLKEPKDEEL
jgi:hypothetical protein